MCDCSESGLSLNSQTSAGTPSTTMGSIMPLGIPLSRAISVASTEGPNVATDAAQLGGGLPTLHPIPPFKLCKLDFRDGCYEIHYQPTGSLVNYEGTLRVDRQAPDAGPDHIIVSGDLYVKSRVIGPFISVPPSSLATSGSEESAGGGTARTSLAGAVSGVEASLFPWPIRKPIIPIFPRGRYHSYLRVTSVSVPLFVSAHSVCQVTLVAEQYNYTQPPAGQFKGTFPSSPSRMVTMRLTPAAAPYPYSLTGGPYYEGRLFEGGVDKGSVTLAWVSKYFRRATVEIDTLVGAVAPAPVPEGTGTAFFDTVFAKTGWQLQVIQDQTNVPVPSGVTPTNCWSSADLHNLMTTVRNPSTDLDKEWRIHLSVVPAKLGCSRGVMFDQIGVPREGCASFCDDGYPTSDSLNFGTAANKKQRDVPRAFLRSATHEITHTFNQIHQEQETSADNSIMTTTPSVADVLGGPATGAPGVFPDQINLSHNATVRHHLNHMPDPVIRPGGWPFASWSPTGTPQASDRHLFDPSELELAVSCESEFVAFGQPVDITWTMTNRCSVSLVAPNDIRTEALFASITVTDIEGRERPVRPFVILCERAKLQALQPGDSVSASSKVFWSSGGFAFERPGHYRVTVSINWSAGGVPVGIESSIDLFIDYPFSDADNRAAGLVLHPEVGKWVALGGGAYHLKEAARRLTELSDTMAATRDAGGATPRLIQGFDGILPERSRVAKLYPEMVSDAGVRTRVVKGQPARRPRKRGKGRHD